MDEFINEFSSYGPVAFLWFVRLMWLSIGAIGVYEATREHLMNLKRYRRFRHAGNSREIISKGRYYRSFWFLLGFLICFATGLTSVVFLIVAAPPRPEVSLQSTILTLLLEAMIVCFWLAKHADRRAYKEAEAYARSHESINDGDPRGQYPGGQYPDIK